MGEGLGSFGWKRTRLGLLLLAALAGAGCFPIARAGVYLEGTVRAVDSSGRSRSGVEMRLEDPGVPRRWREPPFQRGLCTTGEDGSCAFQVQYVFCRTIYLPWSWSPRSKEWRVVAYLDGREVGRQVLPDAGVTVGGRSPVAIEVVVRERK